MTEKTFKKEDIGEEEVKRFNAYIKCAFKRALSDIYRRDNNCIEQTCSFCDVAETVGCEDEGLLEAEVTSLEFFGFMITLKSELAELLNQLSEKKQASLVLNEVFNIPIAEIAKMLRVTERSVKSYKKQALEFLREEINKNESL